MTEEQSKAAQKLNRALKTCMDVELAVYIWDANVYVCPQPEGSRHDDFDHAPADTCDDIGLNVTPPGLDCDGGAGS